MSSTHDAPLNSLLTIFNITKKSDLIDHCRDVVIDGTDLANLIGGCMVGAIAVQLLVICVGDGLELGLVLWG